MLKRNLLFSFYWDYWKSGNHWIGWLLLSLIWMELLIYIVLLSVRVKYKLVIRIILIWELMIKSFMVIIKGVGIKWTCVNIVLRILMGIIGLAILMWRNMFRVYSRIKSFYGLILRTLPFLMFWVLLLYRKYLKFYKGVWLWKI